MNAVYQRKQDRIKERRELKKQERLKKNGTVMYEICQTIKKGKECVFMMPEGCFFEGGHCDPIIEKCIGCANIEILPTGQYCNCYASPEAKWSARNCNRATHIVVVLEKEKFIDPLKKSKRSMRASHGR